MVSHSLRAVILAAMIAPAALAQDADTTVATVNGHAVALGDLIAVRADLPPQYKDLPDEALYDGLRRQLVDQTLLADAAEKAGLAEGESFQRMVEIQTRSLLANLYLQQEIEKQVTDEAIQRLYDAQIGSAEPVTEIRASHILVDSKEKAEALLAEIEGGADFAELAGEHGTDGTKTRGGDLGWFPREAMVPDFADAAFAIEEEGAVAGPVETSFGFHLIKLTGKREKPKPTLEEMRAQLADELREGATPQIINSLREGAEIDLPDERPGLAALRDESLIGR